MSWAKLDDRITEHPKFISLNDAGWSLFVRTLIYACRYRTDGFVDATVVRRMGSIRTAKELLRRRIWERAAGGFRIHDFLDYQLDANGHRPPPPDLSAKRASAGRKGAAARWHKAADDDDPPGSSGDGNSGSPMANAIANEPSRMANFAAPDLPYSRSPDTQRARPDRPGFAPAGPVFAGLLDTLMRNRGGNG